MQLPSDQIAQIINEWQLYLGKQRNYSYNSLQSYLSDIQNFLTFVTGYASKDITLQILKTIDIRLIRSWLSFRVTNNYSATSNARALSALKNFYKYLEKEYNIVCHSLFVIKTPKKPKILPKSLSQQETLESIYNIGVSNDVEWICLRNKALLSLLYATGLRISEALSITKTDLRDKEFICITGKGGFSRYVPWIDQVKNLIDEYLDILPYNIEDSEPIFRGMRGGVLRRAVFNKELMALRRQLGFPEYLSAHAFRHSFATDLLENGADLRAIQEMLGHKTLSTTQRYTKINRKHLQSTYNATHPLSR